MQPEIAPARNPRPLFPSRTRVARRNSLCARWCSSQLARATRIAADGTVRWIASPNIWRLYRGIKTLKQERSRTVQHSIVSREEWIAARKQLLNQEKELTHALDALNTRRRELPWVKVDKEYVFDTAQGKKTLAELFEGRSQLFVQHFMLGPGKKAGCVGCSFFADHVDGANLHIAHHDITFVAVSRAPLSEIEAYKKRMGWKFNWVSSGGGDFNYDFHVSFTKEEMAKGKVYYNYDVMDAQTEDLPGVSIFSRTNPARYITPIQPTRAGTSADSAPTCSSTSLPRAAKRTVPTTI